MLIYANGRNTTYYLLLTLYSLLLTYYVSHLGQPAVEVLLTIYYLLLTPYLLTYYVSHLGQPAVECDAKARVQVEVLSTCANGARDAR